MRCTILTICGAVLVGCILVFALRHHVVLSEDGVLLLCKRHSTFSDTFVDLRDPESFDEDRHPHLAEPEPRRDAIAGLPVGRSLMPEETSGRH